MSRRQISERVTPHPTLKRAVGSLSSISDGQWPTAAAAVMVVVFVSFAASSEHVIKLFGLALASAVFLDALVIRTILLPAVLELLGRTTWSFPRALDRRLPRVALEARHEPAAELLSEAA